MLVQGRALKGEEEELTKCTDYFTFQGGAKRGRYVRVTVPEGACEVQVTVAVTEVPPPPPPPLELKIKVTNDSRQTVRVAAMRPPPTTAGPGGVVQAQP